MWPNQLCIWLKLQCDNFALFDPKLTVFNSRLIVLITIRRGLLKLEKKIKKIIFLMSPPQSKHSTLEKNNVSEKPMEDFQVFSLSKQYLIFSFYRYLIKMVMVWNTSHHWIICHYTQRQCRKTFVVGLVVLANES